MVDHIYGRCSLLVNKERQHVFIREIQLQLNYLFSEIKNASIGLPARSQQKLIEVKENLKRGIEYYQKFARETLEEQRDNFLSALHELQNEIDNIHFNV